MKKIFAILMAICLMAGLMAGALCVPVFAADAPAAGTKIRVSAVKSNGSTFVIRDYSSFEDGWNAAMERAKNLRNYDYSRIIVDFYADWTAVDGEFGDDSGDGFDNETLYIPEHAQVTINLNNHTINRALDEWIYDGEVLYVDEYSNVIINDGTIKGGWSANGAGGIHVKENVNITLNNVHIDGNTADDADGGGISIENSTLTMNGGSFKNNLLIGSSKGDCGGALSVIGGTAILNNVEIKNNLTEYDYNYGSAIYALNSSITLTNCTFEGNSMQSPTVSTFYSSVIYAKASTVSVKNSTFGNHYINDIFQISSSKLSIESSVFTGAVNTQNFIRISVVSGVYITDTSFTDSATRVISGEPTEGSYFRNCTFRNTAYNGNTFSVSGDPLECYDCDFGDTKYDSKYMIVQSTAAKENTLIGISGIRKDGTTAFTSYYDNFEDGWDMAMEIAGDEATMAKNSYDRIVVDIYADWTAAADGNFTDDRWSEANGSGFKNDTIYIPENAKVTLNLNGHTVNRNVKSHRNNGEVIYIDENADVIINDGTITGGYSDNGAGGIHIKDNARVVLNNVNVIGNKAVGSDGAAIAVYTNAILTMNGGSLSNNYTDIGYVPGLGFIPLYAYGTLHVNNATAMLSNVTISNNYTDDKDSEGVAVYAENSTVTLNDCVVSGNATDENGQYAESVMAAFDSTLIIKNTDFTGNGVPSSTNDSDHSHLFYLKDSTLTLTGGKITGNTADKLFYFDDTEADIRDVTMTDNASVVLDVDNGNETVTLTACVLGNNSPVIYDHDMIVDTAGTLILTNCDLGDTTFKDKTMVSGVGSVFGEGSLTMIVAILALIASGVSISLVVDMKKKLVPATAKANGAESEDE